MLLYKEYSLQKSHEEVNMKKWFVGMLALMVVVAATSVFAFGPGGCGGRGGGFFGGEGPGAFERLNLSKEQMDQMWQLREKFQNETKDLRYQMYQKRREMKTLFADSKADDAAIRAQYTQMSALRQKLQDKRVEFKLAQRHILTPDQLQELGQGSFGRGFGRGGQCCGDGNPEPAAFKPGPRRSF
jgi:Spy/CpxP family protein refolding chaperone